MTTELQKAFAAIESTDINVGHVWDGYLSSLAGWQHEEAEMPKEKVLAGAHEVDRQGFEIVFRRKSVPTKQIEDLKMQVLNDMRKRYPAMTSGDLQTAVLAMTRFWGAYCKANWEEFFKQLSLSDELDRFVNMPAPVEKAQEKEEYNHLVAANEFLDWAEKHHGLGILYDERNKRNLDKGGENCPWSYLRGVFQREMMNLLAARKNVLKASPRKTPKLVPSRARVRMLTCKGDSEKATSVCLSHQNYRTMRLFRRRRNHENVETT
jgi:hypothetical protein